MDNQALKDYFKFDDEDLQANKAGRFSAAQTRRLHSRQSGAIREKRIVSLIGIPLSLILLLVMAYLILSGSTAHNSTNTAYVFWLGLTLVAAGLFAIVEAVTRWCVVRACGLKTKA